MFFKKVHILAISRDRIVAAIVRLRDKKIIRSYSGEWNVISLRGVLEDAIKTLKADKIRLLIADDLSYTLLIKVPRDIEGKSERDLIYEKIKEEIPETLENSDWDFKESKRINTGESGEYKEVLVFAPVKGLLKQIKTFLDNLNISVVAVEPQILASSRHTNPLIGLALKEDLKGRDEEVLNLDWEDSHQIKDVGMHQAGPDRKRKGSVLFKKALIILAVILGLLAFIFSVIYFGKISVSNFFRSIGFNAQSNQKNTPLTEEKEIYGYSINLINGSEQEENAEEVKKNLLENGFLQVSVDSNSAGYETSVVKIKENVPPETIEEIKNSIREFEVIYPDTFIEGSYKYDVEIVLGKRKTS